MAIRGISDRQSNQMQSVAISSNQRQSVAIRGHPYLEALGALLRRDRLHELLYPFASILERVASSWW